MPSAILRGATCLGFALALVACTDQVPAVPAAGGKPAPLVIASGSDSRMRVQQFFAISDGPTWTRIWQEHAGATAVPPAVDFGSQIVLAVFSGDGVGYEITIPETVVTEGTPKRCVWPSGTALATISVPIIVPAPARRSTTTCRPQRLVSSLPTRREVVSLGPPGAVGTTMRIERLG